MNMRSVADKANCRTFALVSRRAAGVWTNLPSLTYALLDLLPSASVAVWVDFGMRYEMFNHFRIDAYGFPADNTLLALMARRSGGQSISASHLTTYDQVVCGSRRQASERPLSCIHGDMDTEYRNTVAERADAGQQIYMIPWHTPLVPPKCLGYGADTQLIDDVLVSVIDTLKPQFMFLTWEGQPEARLFRPRLREDSVLGWGLGEAHQIVSFVRFDSEERFRDSVSIPSLLAEEQSYREKLNLVLTRASRRPCQDVAASGYVIGQLPFADSVGQAVNSGRVPIIDIWNRERMQSMQAGEKHYLEAVTSLARRLVERGNAE